MLIVSARLALKAFLFCSGLMVLNTAKGADWPQWRGPNRDGIVEDLKHPLNQLPEEPRVLWKMETGPGQASPVIAGGKLIFLDARNNQETAHCVEAATGQILWSVELGPTVEFSPAFGGGPRSTPLIDGDRVYAQTSAGEFRCLALADGKVLWKVSFGADYGATFLGKGKGAGASESGARYHGHNGSAAIDGNRIFVPVGSSNGATLVCFDKKSGQEIWRAGEDDTAYSSVMVATLAGVRQVVHFTLEGLMGVDAASGKILWRELPPAGPKKRHVCTPVIGNDSVVVTSSSAGAQKFNIVQKKGSLKAGKAWTNADCKTVLGTPTLLGKNLFTIGPGDRTELICLDFETGAQRWTHPGFSDYASLTTVNDKILVLKSTGELILVKADPAKYEELGRTQVSAMTWASPAYADGILYVKDEKNLRAIVLVP